MGSSRVLGASPRKVHPDKGASAVVIECSVGAHDVYQGRRQLQHSSAASGKNRLRFSFAISAPCQKCQTQGICTHRRRKHSRYARSCRTHGRGDESSPSLATHEAVAPHACVTPLGQRCETRNLRGCSSRTAAGATSWAETLARGTARLPSARCSDRSRAWSSSGRRRRNLHRHTWWPRP